VPIDLTGTLKFEEKTPHKKHHTSED